MNKAFLLIVFLCGWFPAFCDTIDNWQVYLNRDLVARFNANDKHPALKLSLKENDTLRIRYRTCSGLTRSVLVWCPDGDSVQCWNDGDYYSRHSYHMQLKAPDDSVYWNNVYQDHGRGEVQILAKDLAPLLEAGTEVPFYYTTLRAHERHWKETLILVLSKKEE
jgi:hypothetical protein